MAAVGERRSLPSPEAMLGQPWSHWVDAAKLHGNDGTALEESFKEYGRNREAMRLCREDMPIFGLCPAHDDFYLVMCNHCNQVVKPQAFQSHYGSCGIGTVHHTTFYLEGRSWQLTKKCLPVTWVHPPSQFEVFSDSPSFDCVTEILPPSARAHTHLSFAGLHLASPKGFFCVGVKCLDSERTRDTCDFN